VLGHEVVGTVEAVGSEVERYKVGDRVAVAHHVPCDECHYCLGGHSTVCETLRRTNFFPGGMAEYIRLPAINVERGVFRLPDEVSFEEATFVEPLACVLRGQKQAGLKPGDNVLVIGSGIAGLLHIYLARAMGAGRVIATDIVDRRLEMARQFGADATINAGEDVPARVRWENDGRLVDRVLVCTGVPEAMVQALGSVDRGGTVLFFAPTDPDVTIPLSVNDVFWRNDVTLTTSYAGSPIDYAAALELIRSGTVQVREMITHRLPLAEAGHGFRLVSEADDSIKIIIYPQR
jgi:L-iditol 2-dehydrogenase